MNFPNHFNANGARFNVAGQGRQACSRSYVCVQNGSMIEAFAGVIVSAGPRFALARILDAPAMGTVHIDASSMPNFQTLMPGQPVLLAALQFNATGAHAGVAAAMRAPAPAPAPRYETGVLESSGAPTWGWIRRDGDGMRVFLHASKLSGPFMPGARVTFQSVMDPRGLTATSARIANNQPRHNNNWR